MKRFTLGSSSITDQEMEYVQKVLQDNYISPGPVVREVEEKCAEMYGIKHALGINSGQSAIHVALQALIAKRINRLYTKPSKPLVAVPACTYISTLAAAILAGCDIALVDVTLPDGNMCPKDLRKVLEYQNELHDPVDILIPVHLFGNPCSLEISEIANEYSLFVVEDACESTFTPNTGWGDILTTSFFSNHLISGGGGGLILTQDDELDLHCWKLINHGRSARFDNDDIHRIADKFHFDTWGHSMKWNDVGAAIVKAQIERCDELYQARQRNAAVLNRAFYGAGMIETTWKGFTGEPIVNVVRSVDMRYMMYPILLNTRLDTLRIIRDLNNHGIETRRMMPIINQPIVQEYFDDNLNREFPNAARINRDGFYVGVHPELSQKDMQEMSQIIIAAVREQVLEVQNAT